jgi:hypothetical protein
VCLGKALAELEIRLLAVGLLQQLTLALEADQDLTLMVIPCPSPADGLLVRAYSRASYAPLPHQHGGLGCRPCRCSGQNWEMENMGLWIRGQRLTFRCTRVAQRAFHP